MEYQKCPICNGNGLVSGGFYDHPGDCLCWTSVFGVSASIDKVKLESMKGGTITYTTLEEYDPDPVHGFDYWERNKNQKPVKYLFHGGCHGCTRQETEKEGVDFCIKCCFFDADWALPSLNNEPPSKADIKRMELKKKAVNIEG